MKKRFKCEIDCANCAAKVTEAIKKIDGVKDASVNFMTQKFKLDADDERFDEILKESRQDRQKDRAGFFSGNLTISANRKPPGGESTMSKKLKKKNSMSILTALVIFLILLITEKLRLFPVSSGTDGCPSCPT